MNDHTGDNRPGSPSPADPGTLPSHSASHAECSEVLHRIYEYLDGEMQPADVARVAQHLEACGPCLHEHDLDRAVKAAVRRSSSTDEACPEQLKVQILRRITMVRIELDR